MRILKRFAARFRLGVPVANNLKKMREAKGLSLVALAAKVGTSSQEVSHLELGKRHLTVEWLTRLAEALGCHPWSIVSDDAAPALSKLEQLLIQRFRRLETGDQQQLVEGLAASTEVRPKPRRTAGDHDRS
jgi:transcriptional regulator with XRE-family HTH domain